MRPSKLKTTLAVLRNTLIQEVETLTSRKNRKTGAFEKIRVKTKEPRLSKQTVKDWLGCSLSKVEHIENGDLPLSSEDALTIARQTGVNFQWLVENDPTKPITKFGVQHGKSCDEPYTVADYEKRQAEMEKLSFKNPLTDRDIWEVIKVMGDAFGRVAAVVLRGLDNGQLDVVEYKMRNALNKIYGKPDSELINLGMKSIFQGSPTLTRPDPTALLDEWETRFKEIIEKKSNGKLPMIYPKIKPLPAIRPPRKPRR